MVKTIPGPLIVHDTILIGNELVDIIVREPLGFNAELAYDFIRKRTCEAVEIHAIIIPPTVGYYGVAGKILSGVVEGYGFRTGSHRNKPYIQVTFGSYVDPSPVPLSEVLALIAVAMSNKGK